MENLHQHQNYTPDQVWAMLAELTKSSQETKRMFQETDRQIKESDRKFQETKELMSQSSLEMRREVMETSKSVKALSKRFGGLGNSWGAFLEGLIEPGIYELFEKRGITVHNKYANVREFKDGKIFYEIDLLVFNDKYVILVEMKSRLTTEHIKQHIQRLEKFQQHPPKNFNLKGKMALGAIAGISVEPEVIEMAQQNGLFILVQKSNLVEIVNTDKFSPREWQLAVQ